jgi:hypothetical protein
MERESIKEAVKEALYEELKSFYIDRETHYKQHEWLASMMIYSETCKNVVLKTLITLVISGLAGLMYLGFCIKQGGK